MVSPTIDKLSTAYPELRENKEWIEKIIKTEEEAFNRSLSTGIQFFNKCTKKLNKGDTVPPSHVLSLYATYGFPEDLTCLMAEEKGLKVNLDEFYHLKAQQLQSSKVLSHIQKSLSFNSCLGGI